MYCGLDVYFAIQPFIWWIALTGISVVRQWLFCANLVQHQVALFLHEYWDTSMQVHIALWPHGYTVPVWKCRWTTIYNNHHSALPFLHKSLNKSNNPYVFCTNMSFSLYFSLLRADFILCVIYSMKSNCEKLHLLILCKTEKAIVDWALDSFTALNSNKHIWSMRLSTKCLKCLCLKCCWFMLLMRISEPI